MLSSTFSFRKDSSSTTQKPTTSKDCCRISAFSHEKTSKKKNLPYNYEKKARWKKETHKSECKWVKAGLVVLYTQQTPLEAAAAVVSETS